MGKCPSLPRQSGEPRTIAVMKGPGLRLEGSGDMPAGLARGVGEAGCREQVEAVARIGAAGIAETVAVAAVGGGGGGEVGGGSFVYTEKGVGGRKSLEAKASRPPPDRARRPAKWPGGGDLRFSGLGIGSGLPLSYAILSF
jgi:hypothetical protein